MGGTELVYNLFAECQKGEWHEGLCMSHPDQVYPIVKAIFVALIVKGALTIVTFGIKVPAGIFIPTLGVGACMGRICGLGVQWLYWSKPHLGIFAACKGDRACIIPGVYAMVSSCRQFVLSTISNDFLVGGSSGNFVRRYGTACISRRYYDKG